jgi:hypothetical protein
LLFLPHEKPEYSGFFHFFLAYYGLSALEIAMLKDMFNFSKKRSGVEAVMFFMFYVGCFALVSLALGFDI